ncbi:aspartate dehydrogenase [Acinetobacter apis]|uniref:L-aspartate dehydrogenase n=1 Tax=Acinetobacter apis TaxID=1229165 RepID=A0A217EEW1_9GAMM|nr:aspartate dehydrogenase [Acinetobacter apis]SNQ28750.1 aspartate dehydrogenase [Acinetobacter apis]
MKQLMMIGYGAMAQEIVKHLPQDLSLTWVVVPEDSVSKTQTEVASTVKVISSIDACDGQPDFVVEAAGQSAVIEHAEQILSRGWKLGLISVGALASDELYQRLSQAVQAHDSKLYLLSGAIAGIDGLAAAKLSGELTNVTYQAVKSPKSWLGSPAEQVLDLNNVQETTVFFKGTAREAASTYKANSNVAATIALAGLGLDETMVELVVDPNIASNQHIVLVEGSFGQFKIEMNGKPLQSNPKTSALAALSVVRACHNYMNNIEI